MGQNIIIQGQTEAARGIHYEVDASLPSLGEGNFGSVRRGQRIDERTGTSRDVAIKFLFDDLSENAIIRAKREASIHIVHENLVEMLGFVQTVEEYNGSRRYHSHVVSELLHGVMLLDLLDGTISDSEGKVIPKAQELYNLLQSNRNKFAITIVRSVLSGIMALHDNGYIHRDIDPSNIMITDQGKIKLLDLGIAKALGEMASTSQHLTSTGDFVGKPAYAAPELVLGDIAHQDFTTDIYAIGVMLYQLTLGRLPFEGSMDEMLKAQLHQDMPVQNIAHKGIREIVKKATNKKQSERYQSAAEFRVAIDNLKDLASNISRVPDMTEPQNGTASDNLYHQTKSDNGGGTVSMEGGTQTVENKTIEVTPVLEEKPSTNWMTIATWGGVIISGLVLGAILALLI